MSTTPILSLKPIISYPSEARLGETYLLTIDVQLSSPDSPWPYEEEEYAISFHLNTYPYFEARPPDEDQEPTLVLHRHGGTYGPAEYLLTAADHEIEPGPITIHFLNARGLPLGKMDLTCTVTNEQPSKTANQREIRILRKPPERAENLSPHFRLYSMPLLTPDNLLEHQFAAIQAIERALAQRKSRILLEMFTGEGVTHTMITSIYRLLEYGGARRIALLFEYEGDAYYAFDTLQTYYLPDQNCLFRDRYSTRHIQDVFDDPQNPDFLIETLRSLNHDANVYPEVFLITLKELALLLAPPKQAMEMNKESFPAKFFDIIFIPIMGEKAYEQYRQQLTYFDTFLVGIQPETSKQTLDFYQQNLVYSQSPEITISPVQLTVKRIWLYYNMVREDNLSFLDYLEQVCLLLFWKIASYQELRVLGKSEDERIWPSLFRDNGTSLIRTYDQSLGLFQQIFSAETTLLSPRSKISDSTKLKYLITGLVDSIDQTFLERSTAAATFDEFLEVLAEDPKSGLGAHFTSRPLIQTIIDVIQPQPHQTIYDPTCGTGGFLFAAYEYIIQNSQLESQASTFRGVLRGQEINEAIFHIAQMNLWLHTTGDRSYLLLDLQNSLPATFSIPEFFYSIVLCDPLQPLQPSPDAVTFRSEVNADAVQLVMSSLNRGGKAAVIVPDSFLYASGLARDVREQLLSRFDLHTILRLPEGIFPQSIKANALFFDRFPSDSSQPQNPSLWIYDYRLTRTFNPRTNPLTRTNLEDFVRSYHPEDRQQREESPLFHRYSYTQIRKNDLLNLDITW